jgi:hypothetical protein
VGKSFVKYPKTTTRKLIIQPQFDTQLTAVLEFGIEHFGARVAHNFYTRVMNKIIALPSMPDIHPKNRFIENTERKTYRNILIEKYSVLYSVTTRTIRVITIYHQAINPEKINKMK